MKRVTSIGGKFFKSENTEKLYGWYEKHLGIKRDPKDGACFAWREPETGGTGYARTPNTADSRGSWIPKEIASSFGK